MDQQGEDNNTQIRSCPRCSTVQRPQVPRTTEYAAGQQDPEPVDRGGASITVQEDNEGRGPQVRVGANIFSHVVHY